MSSLALKFLKLCPSHKSRYEMALSYLVIRAVMHEEEQKKQKLSRRRRILRERFAMNSIPDKEFIYKYRLSRELFDKLCAEVSHLLPPKQGPNELDPSIKILAVLNFYAWGRLQHSTSKHFGLLANNTMSRCIREVTNALTHSTIVQKYIKFPKSKEERDVIKKKFFEKFGFPDVIGCIDCNHIAITKQVENEVHYLNDHDYYSVLAQIICDAGCNILSVRTSVGALDYSDVWYEDPISDHLNSLDDTAYLIGNSNYNLEEHLMIPIAVQDVTENSPESRYNDLHKTVYATIDQTIYKLKSRWRCLLTRKELQYDHDMAGRILIACSVLHNMCNMAGLEAPEMSERDIEEERKRQDDHSDASCDYYDEEYRVKLVQEIEENRLRACGGTMEVTCGNTEVTCGNSMEAKCGDTVEDTCSNTKEAIFGMKAPCSNTTEAMSGNATEATCSNTTAAICGNTMEAPCSNTTEAMCGNTTEATCSNTTEATCIYTMDAPCSNSIEAMEG